VNRLYWHTLGTPQADDRLVYERPDRPNCILTLSSPTMASISYCMSGTAPFRKIASIIGRGQRRGIHSALDEADAHYGFLGNAGQVFTF